MVNVQYLTAAVSMTVATFAQAKDPNLKCTGINFGIRAGPDWAPAEEKCKPASQIASELALLKDVTDVIRLYSLTDCNQATAVVPAAIEAGLKIELGIWVDASTSSFEAEKAAFKTLLETGLVTGDNIVGIHVGSEAVYRGDVTVSVAIANLEEIRALCHANPAAASIPLTIADIGDTYTAHPELIEVVDYVSANYFPFWELMAIDGAADHFYARFSALVKIVSTYNKEVIVGETGWASQGMSANGSIATEANAAKFFYDFYTLAAEKNLTYYYFSAFDEPWKLATLDASETVEAYFGLFTEEGVLKDAIASQFGDDTKSADSSGVPPAMPSSDATAVQEVTGTDELSEVNPGKTGASELSANEVNPGETSADELSANEDNFGETGAEVLEDPTKAAETTSDEVPEDLTKTATTTRDEVPEDSTKTATTTSAEVPEDLTKPDETTESHEDCAM